MAEKKDDKKPDVYSAEFLVKEYLRRNAKAEHIIGRHVHQFGQLYQKGLDAVLSKAVEKYKLKSKDEVHLDQIQADKELRELYKNTILKGHEELALAAAGIKLDKLGPGEDPEVEALPG